VITQKLLNEVKELRIQKVQMTKSLAAAEDQVRMVSHELVNGLTDQSLDIMCVIVSFLSRLRCGAREQPSEGKATSQKKIPSTQTRTIHKCCMTGSSSWRTSCGPNDTSWLCRRTATPPCDCRWTVRPSRSNMRSRH
jgi:hypothetical protein